MAPVRILPVGECVFALLVFRFRWGSVWRRGIPTGSDGDEPANDAQSHKTPEGAPARKGASRRFRMGRYTELPTSGYAFVSAMRLSSHSTRITSRRLVCPRIGPPAHARHAFERRSRSHPHVRGRPKDRKDTISWNGECFPARGVLWKPGRGQAGVRGEAPFPEAGGTQGHDAITPPRDARYPLLRSGAFPGRHAGRCVPPR